MTQSTQTRTSPARQRRSDQDGRFLLDLHRAASRTYVSYSSHGLATACLVAEITRIEAALERLHPRLWSLHGAALLAEESALWHSPDLPIANCLVCQHGPRTQDVLDIPAPPRR